jgi:SPP1 gp7 family putative phage head morphogenesis protein
LVNRARPDIIISGSKELPLAQEEGERLNEVWMQRFGGPENQGKPFWSSAPLEVKTLTPSFRELQLTKLREFERDIIVTVFGVPPEIMGILANSNRATIDAAELLFSKYVLTPRLEARRAAYNEQLAWQYDERLFLDFEDPVEENKEFKLEVTRSRPAAFTDDEVRALAGEGPLPVDDAAVAGGAAPTDVQAAALNGAQIAALQAIVQQVAVNEIPPATAIQMILVAFPTIDEDTAIAIINPAAGFSPMNGETRALAREGEALPPPDTAALPPGPALERSILLRSGRATKQTLDDINTILSAVDQSLMSGVVEVNTRTIVAEFGGDAMADAGVNISFDLDNPRAVEFISQTAGERSDLINGTTQKDLRVTLSEGIAEGETQRDLIKRVQSVVTDATSARADMIARTETTRAAGFATEEGMLQSNLTEKEWLPVQDDRTRDTHAGMEGQTQPLGESFVSPSGATATYPGNFGVAEEDINCRCVLIAVDSLPDKAARVAKWHTKASQMERLQGDYARQLRSVFREQGKQVVDALEDV